MKEDLKKLNIEESNINTQVTILVVEDDEGLNRLIQKRLQRADFCVEGVLTGADAIARVVENQNLIILLDYLLPDMTGREVFEALAKRKCSVPVIIMTGHGDEKIAVEMMKLGARDYIVKDQNFIDILPQLIKNVCEDLEKEKRLARMSKALEESNHQLEKTLTELRATQQQIIQQERLRALGQLASGIAHDFNNNLTPILGFTDVLLDSPESLDDKESVRYYLTLINTAAKDASHVVSRLREFYRRRDEEEEIMMSVNINQLVKQTIELTQPKWKDQAQANSITIDIEADLQEVPLISGNEEELREVLTNLILNAVDAMPKNGTITLRTRFEGKQVVLEVSDTGVGMTEEVKQRCFEPFFSTKQERGTGLGLAMVYGIINRGKGTIEILSEPGRGTTFIINLPIQIKQQVKERGKETEVPLRSLHVLVVDDETMVRDVVTKYLTADGHTVETATNGREGLEKFHSGRFHLVITDRAMPDMGGVQLAALIKQLAPKMPIIMLTGFGDIMAAQGTMPEGVDFLLSKPITLTAFREALAKFLSVFHL